VTVRRAILSDIHGNLPALTATLTDIDSHIPDQLICLGDIVGYGASPFECIELVREHCSHIIAGNHDFGVCGNESLDWFNPWAKQAALWTRERLSGGDLLWLSNLPLEHRDGSLHFVHGAPGNPAAWDYVRGNMDARRALQSTDAATVFVGHSHLPGIYSFEDGKTLINVGSVGQARDGDPRACWCLFDDDSRGMELIRVQYPVEEAQQAIRGASLPDYLAQRLAEGR
jgi:diadenosine tetraphosphatase ApaH/serine/threonine PP2A family protein phosphatase